MEFKKLMTATALMGVMLVGASAANAKTEAQAAFNARYLTDDTACTTCHASALSTNANAVGAAWLAAGGRKDSAPTNWDSFDTATGFASDVDPAWVAPAAATSSSSGGGCVAGSVATPLTMVLAMLALGFFVRRKKD